MSFQPEIKKGTEVKIKDNYLDILERINKNSTEPCTAITKYGRAIEAAKANSGIIKVVGTYSHWRNQQTGKPIVSILIKSEEYDIMDSIYQEALEVVPVNIPLAV